MRLRQLQQHIDATVRKNGGAPGFEEDEPRYHLGASIIGKECWREIWYSFRWARTDIFEGRMLRLFETGHRYETRFKLLLEEVGATVEDVDPATVPEIYYHDGSDSYVWWMPGETPHFNESLDCVSDIPWHVMRARDRHPEIPKPKQHRFAHENGHFGGSLDSKAWKVPFVQTASAILAEYKTHGDKSFLKLVDEGVEKAKPEHAAQTRIYMEKKQLPVTLYCAVNKNTDDLEFQIIEPKPAQAQELELKATKIIYTDKPPARISQSPSNFGCKFCDFRLICHYGQPMEKNCRTCVFSRPVDGGEWLCTKWKANIPRKVQPVGCGEYKQLTD